MFSKWNSCDIAFSEWTATAEPTNVPSLSLSHSCCSSSSFHICLCVCVCALPSNNMICWLMTTEMISKHLLYISIFKLDFTKWLKFFLAPTTHTQSRLSKSLSAYTQVRLLYIYTNIEHYLEKRRIKERRRRRRRKHTEDLSDCWNSIF